MKSNFISILIALLILVSLAYSQIINIQPPTSLTKNKTTKNQQPQIKIVDLPQTSLLSDTFNFVSHPTKCYRKFVSLYEGYYQLKINYQASFINGSKSSIFSGIKNSYVSFYLNQIQLAKILPVDLKLQQYTLHIYAKRGLNSLILCNVGAQGQQPYLINISNTTIIQFECLDFTDLEKNPCKPQDLNCSNYYSTGQTQNKIHDQNFDFNVKIIQPPTIYADEKTNNSWVQVLNTIKNECLYQNVSFLKTGLYRMNLHWANTLTNGTNETKIENKTSQQIINKTISDFKIFLNNDLLQEFKTYSDNFSIHEESFTFILLKPNPITYLSYCSSTKNENITIAFDNVQLFMIHQDCTQLHNKQKSKIIKNKNNQNSNKTLSDEKVDRKNIQTSNKKSTSTKSETQKNIDNNVNNTTKTINDKNNIQISNKAQKTTQIKVDKKTNQNIDKNYTLNKKEKRN